MRRAAFQLQTLAILQEFICVHNCTHNSAMLFTTTA